jgi:hypothetical protein
MRKFVICDCWWPIDRQNFSILSIKFFFILWQSKFTSIGPSLSTRCIVYKLVLVINIGEILHIPGIKQQSIHF